MNDHQDIRKAVEIINERILKLEQIKAMLLEEFGAPAVLGPSESRAQMRLPVRLPVRANRTPGETRKEQLVRFFAEHGPSRRARILAESGMPKGTVASLLNDDDFIRHEDGTWDLRHGVSAPQEITQ